jgi:cytidylate kinase
MSRAVGLFVGVNQYRPDSGLTDLRFSGNDATAVCKLIESVSNVETALLQTNYVSMDAFLKDLSFATEKQLSRGDAVILFFSGHGYTHAGKDYLAFSTSVPSDDTTAFALSDLMSSLRQTGAGKFFLILDCCRSIKPNAGVSPFRISASTLDSSYDGLMLLGCSPGETSQEDEALGCGGLGIFTAALCSVIESYDRIPLYLLEREIRRETARSCVRYGFRFQRPQMIGSLSLASYDFLRLKVLNLEVARRRVIVVSGTTESGKTSIGRMLQSELGLSHIEMSRFVRQRYREYVGTTGENLSLQDFVENVLWNNCNYDTVAKHALNELSLSSGGAVITGARRPEEIAAFLNADVDCLLVYLDAKAGTRWSRMIMDSQDAIKSNFEARNLRELGWGLADVELFDETNRIKNEGQISEPVRAVIDLWKRRFGIDLFLRCHADAGQRNNSPFMGVPS